MTCRVAYADPAGSRAFVTVADERRPLTRLAAVTICVGTMTAAAARELGATWLRFHMGQV